MAEVFCQLAARNCMHWFHAPRRVMNTPMHCCFYCFVRGEQFKCHIKWRQVKSGPTIFQKTFLNSARAVADNSFTYHCSARTDCHFVRCSTNPLHLTIKSILKSTISRGSRYIVSWCTWAVSNLVWSLVKAEVSHLYYWRLPAAYLSEKLSIAICSCFFADIAHAEKQLMTATNGTMQKLIRTIDDLEAQKHMLQNAFVHLYDTRKYLDAALWTFPAIFIHCSDVGKTFENVDVEKTIATIPHTKLHNNTVI